MEIKKQINIIEDLVDEQSNYLVGNEVSLADAAMFPTTIFFMYILPRHFDWKEEEVLGPKLMKWWNFLVIAIH